MERYYKLVRLCRPPLPWNHRLKLIGYELFTALVFNM